MNRRFVPLIVLLAFLSGFVSSYAQFGKNKVQYQDFHWKFINSKHFDIYYYDDAKNIADYTAVRAEEALISVQNTLNYRLTKRIPIIVYNTHNEFQQTNAISDMIPEGVGGVTELFKNRMVLPFQDSYSMFDHVIHHELVHAVLNDMFYGGTFQSALTSGNAVQIPIWMNEGLAEFESIGGMDPPTDMFMRDMALSESLYPLEYLNGYLAYRGGQTFYWYVAEKYGREKITDLINRLRIYGDVDAAFRSTFRLSLQEFSEQWVKDLKKYYWPDIGKYKGPEEFSSRLTDHKKSESFYNSSPSISPDGEKMAFISDRDGVLSIYVENLTTRQTDKLVSSARTRDFEDLNLLTPGISWNPSGTKLAISAKTGGEDAIYIVDPTNGDFDKLTFGLKSISSVTWSRNGEKLAFIGSLKGKSDIFIYSMASHQLMNLTDDIFTDSHPAWAPDSRTLYFVSDRGDHVGTTFGDNDFRMWNIDVYQTDIYAVDTETREIKRITHEPDYSKTSIAVSSDGNKLLYTSDKNGISNIYEMNLASGVIRPKTNSLDGITQLSLSPDDSKLLYCTQDAIGFDIFLIQSPFEKNLGMDTLPVTELRHRFLQRKQITDQIGSTSANASPASDSSNVQGYGSYGVEFSRQKVVKPNPDVQERAAQDQNNNAVKGESATDTTFAAHDYKLKFTPDIIVGNPSYNTYFGFQGVAQVLMSDILGDHQLLLQANLLIDLRNSNFYAAYWYLPKTIDYMISAFHSAAFVYRSDNQLYRFRNWGAALQASYPFDTFNRLEWGISWLNLSREPVPIDPSAQTAPNVSRMLFVPEGRYVHDDVLWGYYAPVRGSRYYVGFQGTPKLSNSGLGFMTITGDYRRYVDFTQYLNLAVRFNAGISLGPNPQKFFLGGTENWINRSFYGDYLPFDEPEDFAFMQFIMPLRGFDVNQLNGSQFFLTNAELRFPLFRALLAGPVPILFQNIMGAFFFDMGGAWYGDLKSFKATKYIKDLDGSDKLMPNDLLMSAGIGIRTNLLGLPLKIDIAWRNEFNKWLSPAYLFSLGYDF